MGFLEFFNLVYGFWRQAITYHNSCYRTYYSISCTLMLAEIGHDRYRALEA